MIEIKEPEPGDKSLFNVIVDGHIIHCKWSSSFLKDKSGVITTIIPTNSPSSVFHSIYIKDEVGLDKFLSHSVSDIPVKLETIHFDIPPILPGYSYSREDNENKDDDDSGATVRLYRDDDDNRIQIALGLIRTTDINELMHTTGAYEYSSAITKQIRSRFSLSEMAIFHNVDPVQNEVSLHVSAPLNDSLTIGGQLNWYVSQIVECYNEAVKVLLEQSRESVKVVLDFPEEVKVYCEQYLLYFVQFLKDLGVSATSELRHEAGKVLFSVTPIDQNEALDKIRSALEVYLVLPSGKLTHSGDNPIEIQRLTANIHHLQGQLSIAQAVLQAKDATIQAQQTSINNLLSGTVIDITPRPDDKEEFLGGAIALTKYQDKGVEINLAEIFRKLKRLFQRG